MKSTGRNTAASDNVIEIMVNPISRDPFSAAANGVSPASICAHDVLEHDDRVIDHEADAERERHQREVIEAVAQEVHGREGADNREGQCQAGNDRGERFRKKRKITITTRPIVSSSVNCTS